MPPPPARVVLVDEAPQPFLCAGAMPLLLARSNESNSPGNRNGSFASSPVSVSQGAFPKQQSSSMSTTAAAAAPGGNTNSLLMPSPLDDLRSQTVLESFLQKQEHATGAVALFMRAGQRRKKRRSRVVFENVSEWKVSRNMDRILGRIDTAFRDARWRWKLIRSYVLREDCVSGYVPARKIVYDVISVTSKHPPPAPLPPTAAQLQKLNPAAALDALIQYRDDFSDHLRTVWTPEVKQTVPRAAQQIHALSLRRTCALLHLSQEDVQRSRLGVSSEHPEDVLSSTDKLLLMKDRATSAQMIRQQFTIPEEEREDLDPAERLRRVQRYGWQVRERLYVPSYDEKPQELDAKIQLTLASLTPRGKAKSMLLPVPSLGDVVMASASPARGHHGIGDWSNMSRMWSSSPRSPRARSPNAMSFRCGANEIATTLDYSFRDIQSLYQLLLMEPRLIVADSQPAPERKQQQHSRGGHHHPHTRIDGLGDAPASSFRGRSATMVDRLVGHHHSEDELLHRFRLYVFTEKDDNPVALKQKVDTVMHSIERSQATLGRRRSTLTLHAAQRARSASMRRFSGSFDHQSRHDGNGKPSQGLSSDVSRVVQRMGLPPHMIALLDHPTLGPHFKVESKQLVARTETSLLPADVPVHVLRLNNNCLGARPFPLQPNHRILPEDDPQRDTRNDPDTQLWKKLSTLSGESGEGTGGGDAYCMRNLAPVILQCITPSFRTIESVDLSGNALQSAPVELLKALPNLRHLKLHSNDMVSFRSLLLVSGLFSPPVSSEEKGPVPGGFSSLKLVIGKTSRGSSLRCQLQSLTLHGNPLCQRCGVQYRILVLAVFPSLRSLDFGCVIDSEREDAEVMSHHHAVEFPM